MVVYQILDWFDVPWTEKAKAPDFPFPRDAKRFG
jgi:hypothetical protein